MKKDDRIVLEIGDINNLGCGVGRAEDGRVVFVKGAVTGDTIEAKIIKVNKSFAVARMEKLITASPYRIKNVRKAASYAPDLPDSLHFGARDSDIPFRHPAG